MLDPPAPVGSPYRVTSSYGWRMDPFGVRGLRFHHGMDIGLPIGSPVYNLIPGEVDRIDVEGVGKGKVNGNAVRVVSPGAWSVSYLHLLVPLCEVGQWLDRGALVGLSGASGPVTGPHLHLAVFLRGKSLDPALFFPPGTLLDR